VAVPWLYSRTTLISIGDADLSQPASAAVAAAALTDYSTLLNLKSAADSRLKQARWLSVCQISSAR